MKNEELYDEAMRLKKRMGYVSAAFLQFKLRISHARAASLIKEIESE